MTRLLFWIGFFVLVVMAIRSKIHAARPSAQRQFRQPPQPAPAEAMACCAHCHVYFPSSEAVHADGRDYCCPAHVRLAPK